MSAPSVTATKCYFSEYCFTTFRNRSPLVLVESLARVSRFPQQNHSAVKNTLNHNSDLSRALVYCQSTMRRVRVSIFVDMNSLCVFSCVDLSLFIYM